MVFDAIVQTDTLLQERLGCKTWSELGFSCATGCVVQIKLRPLAFLIVLTDRIGIKAHQKKGQTEVLRVELCYTRVYECGVSVAGWSVALSQSAFGDWQYQVEPKGEVVFDAIVQTKPLL